MGILDYQSSFPPLTTTLSEEKLKQRPIHERLVARNWKLMTPKDFRKLPPIQQGKWHNYENPRWKENGSHFSVVHNCNMNTISKNDLSGA